MRFNDKVVFVQEGEETYNPNTGNYDLGEPTEMVEWANVSDSGMERSSMLYGDVKEGALTIRLRYVPPDDYDYIKYKNKKYVVDLFRQFKGKSTLSVSEKQ